MRKIFTTAFVAVLGLVGLNAQTTGFEAGAYVGIPVADVADGSSFNIGANVAYYFEVADKFKVGGLVGYDHFVGKEETFMGVDYKEDAGFIPIAASAKYNFTDSFFAGVDLGYAIGVTDGVDGGFLYRPRVGWSTTSFDLYGFYKGITSNRDYGAIGSVTYTIGSVGVGAAYKF